VLARAKEHLMNRSRTALSKVVLVGPIVLGSLLLTACGSDKATTPDTTIAVSEDSILDETTLAPVEEPVAVETTIATAETTPAETTAAPADTEPPATETTAAGAAGSDVTLDAALGQFVSSLGVADPDAMVACIKEQAPGLALKDLQVSDSMSPGLFRGIARCGDGVFAKQAAGGIEEDITDTEKQCVAQSTFTTVADSDDALITELLALDGTKDFPEDVKTKIIDLIVKDCGLSNEVATKVINSGGDESTDTTVAA
jgi:hypothetical protein